jgi:hypothetical protein
VLHYLRNRLSVNTASNLESELKNSNLLPKRVDWTGNEIELDYDDLVNIISAEIIQKSDQINYSRSFREHQIERVDNFTS